MVKITKRHDLIVERLLRASTGSWSVLKKNQPLAGSTLRPDLVPIKNNCVMILDVAVTFENGPQAFDKIRNEKLRKYGEITKKLSQQYDEATVEAVVVGALGSWDPRNDRVCHRLCTRKYTSLMRKLIVTDTL